MSKQHDDPVDRINENDVVEVVASMLVLRGFRIETKLTTIQQGEDIVAVRDGSDPFRVSIEAKGATSARENSYRFGRPFESAAVRVHVSEAVFKALQVLSQPPGDIRLVAAIALPDNHDHRRVVSLVQPMLARLGIALIWVDGDLRVTIEPADALG